MKIPPDTQRVAHAISAHSYCRGSKRIASVVELATSVLNCRAAAIFLFNDYRYEVLAIRGTDLDSLALMHEINDFQTGNRIFDSDSVLSVTHKGLPFQCGVPISNKGVNYGSLVVYSDSPVRMSLPQRELLLFFGRHINFVVNDIVQLDTHEVEAEFAETVRHKARNLLAVISGYGQILASTLESEHPAAEQDARKLLGATRELEEVLGR